MTSEEEARLWLGEKRTCMYVKSEEIVREEEQYYFSGIMETRHWFAPSWRRSFTHCGQVVDVAAPYQRDEHFSEWSFVCPGCGGIEFVDTSDEHGFMAEDWCWSQWENWKEWQTT